MDSSSRFAAPKPLNILVVNDTPCQLDIEVALLDACGHSVTGLLRAEDIHAIPEAQFPNLFLINLKQGDGYGLSQRIRERSPKVGVLLVTHAGESRMRAFMSGADRHLINPYEVDELLAMISSLSHRLV